jgi:hypothetical protein
MGATVFRTRRRHDEREAYGPSPADTIRVRFSSQSGASQRTQGPPEWRSTGTSKTWLYSLGIGALSLLAALAAGTLGAIVVLHEPPDGVGKLVRYLLLSGGIPSAGGDPAWGSRG